MSDSPDIQAQIQGEVAGEVAVGSYILQVGSVHGGVVNSVAPGAQPRPAERSTPVLLRPRPVSGWLNRQYELETAAKGVRASLPVEISGEPGVGRTALLRRLAHTPDLTAPHGVVYLNAAGHVVGDLLQSLVQAFYDCPPTYKATPTALHVLLRDRRGLVLIDDLELTRDGVERLLDALPESSVVIASRQRALWGEAQSIGLSGLTEADSALLLERELGRPVADEEQAALRKLTAALGGHPIRLLLAGAVARQAKVSLRDILTLVERQGASALTSELVRSLEDEDRKVLGALAVMEMALPIEAVAAIAEVTNTAPSLRRLMDCGLVYERNAHYAMTAGVLLPRELVPNREAARGRALAFYADWAVAKVNQPEAVAPEANTLLQLQKEAAFNGQSARVLGIGTALSPMLALAGRWDAWATVLDRNLFAARAIADRSAEALALHDAGTRALCVDDAATARRLLGQAVDIRTAAGDHIGAAISQHNVGVLAPLPPQSTSPTPRPDVESPVDYDTIRTAEAGDPVFIPAAAGSPWATTALLIALGLVGVVAAAWLFNRDTRVVSTQAVNTTEPPSVTPEVAEPTREAAPVTPAPPPVAAAPAPPPAAPDRAEPATEPDATTPDLSPPPAPSPAADDPAAVAVAGIPSSVNFGARAVNASDRRTLAIASRGARPLSISSVRIGGDHGLDFEILANTCADAALPGGERCEILIGFMPSAPGRRNGELEIIDNSERGFHLVSLAGEATAAPAPRVRLSPDRLEFQRQVIGQPGAARSMRVTNEGNAPLAIKRVTLEGLNARDFKIANNTCAGKTLAPRGTCTVDVTFGPTGAGPRAGLLTVVHSASDQGGTAADLIGTADAVSRPDGRGEIAMSPEIVQFGVQNLRMGEVQNVILRNSGSAAVVVGSLNIEPRGMSDFVVIDRARCVGAPLDPGVTCTVGIRFTPTVAGTREAAMVMSGAADAQAVVTLRGTGR